MDRPRTQRSGDFQSPALDAAEAASYEEMTQATASYEGEACRIAHFDPSRVEIEATLVEPGLVVLREQFYPGWRLEVQTAGEPPRSVPIERFDRVFRGVRLPAGEHRLIYTYRPASFLWGAVLSGSWMRCSRLAACSRNGVACSQNGGMLCSSVHDTHVHIYATARRVKTCHPPV